MTAFFSFFAGDTADANLEKKPPPAPGAAGGGAGASSSVHVQNKGVQRLVSYKILQIRAPIALELLLSLCSSYSLRRTSRLSHYNGASKALYKARTVVNFYFDLLEVIVLIFRIGSVGPLACKVHVCV
jgi:hypothetical protein